MGHHTTNWRNKKEKRKTVCLPSTHGSDSPNQSHKSRIHEHQTCVSHTVHIASCVHRTDTLYASEVIIHFYSPITGVWYFLNRSHNGKYTTVTIPIISEHSTKVRFLLVLPLDSACCLAPTLSTYAELLLRLLQEYKLMIIKYKINSILTKSFYLSLGCFSISLKIDLEGLVYLSLIINEDMVTLILNGA